MFSRILIFLKRSYSPMGLELTLRVVLSTPWGENLFNLISCRSEMNAAMMADINQESEFREVYKRWGEKFQVEAAAIVDEVYDKKAIKGNKALEQVYEDCIQLEVRKAIVYAIMGKQARKNVDEMTDKLGMAYSTLAGSTTTQRRGLPTLPRKRRRSRRPGLPPPRRRLIFGSGSVTALKPCRRRNKRIWRPSWTPTAPSRPPWRSSRRKMLNNHLWTTPN